MAITISATDVSGTALLAQITAFIAAAAAVTSTQHANAINVAIAAKKIELLNYLIGNGKIGYTAIFANETYGI
jgi:hypothetical protein